MPFFWTFRRNRHEADRAARRPEGMGMSASSREIEREALSWLVRVNDAAFAEWDAWDEWMAADARHAETYWRLAETEAEAIEALKSAPLRSATRPSARRWFAPQRSAIAAAVATLALGGLWFAWSDRPQPWTIETAAGEQRTVVLADGSRVSLDGATRLTLDRRDPRDVSLQAGRALFEVVHDESDPFRVAAGDASLTDLGTTFDVTRLNRGVRVSVSEGVVRVDQDGASATLNAGEGVLATPQGLERRSLPPEDVGGWREGRLSYADETLGVVAQDLERALHRPVRVAPSLSERRFTGSLSTRMDASELRPRLSRLLGVSIVEDGDGWRLEP
jgi:transmembrane sensor